MNKQTIMDFEAPGKERARELFLTLTAQAFDLGFQKKYYWDGQKVFGGMFYRQNLLISIFPGYDWDSRSYDLHRVRAQLIRIGYPIKIRGDKVSRPWIELIPITDITSKTDIQNFLNAVPCQLTEKTTQKTGTKSASK